MKRSELTIEFNQAVFEPGSLLTGSYRMVPTLAATATSVDIHIFWRTEGKGDEDGADQHRETRTTASGELFDDTGTAEFSIRLPTTPFSYDGLIIKIIWFLEIRVHTKSLTLFEATVPFQLGHVGPVAEVNR